MLRWKRILVATDFSEPAAAALTTAERLAKIAGGTVWVVHVADLAPPYVEPLLLRAAPIDPEEAWLRRERAGMTALLRDLRRRIPDARGFVQAGAPWRHVVGLAEAGEVDGICIGVSGHSRIDRILMGSTAENVIRHSPVPVLATRREPLGSVNRVLLPTEMDEGSREAIRYAVERFGPRVELTALHVVPAWPALEPSAFADLPTWVEFERLLREFLDGIEGGERVEARVVAFADPASTIVELARDERPDLIVVATHGRRGIARALLGSVAEKVVRYTEPPVLVLPGPRAVEKGEKARREGRLGLEGEVDPPEPARPRAREAAPSA